MSSLVTIPGAIALHLPAKGAAPVPLANGDLTLTLLPAQPPTRPTETVTLSVGSSTFILAKNSPVQRIRSKNEHPSFVFTPAPPEGGQSIGQVRIDMSDSASPEAWERTENGCSTLEAELKKHGVWEDKELFVDDEYETDGPVTGPKVGWGESISSAVLGGASFLVSRLTGRAAPEPSLPTTAPATHVPTAAPAQQAEQPADFKSMAADSWNQASIAARGIGEAAVAVGGALGQQARSAVDGLREQAPAPPNKDAPATKDGATLDPVDAPTTSATTAALDAPSAASAPAAKEETATAKAEAADTKKV